MAELSKSDRSILIELLELQNMISHSPRREMHIEALREGYTDHYPSDVRDLPDEISESLTSYVYDVLNMYDWLQRVLQDPVTGDVSPEAHCPGFDGNGSSGAYSYVLFLTEQAGRYEYIVFEHGSANSHGSEPDYRAMLNVWRTIDRAELWQAARRRDSETIEFAEAVLAAGRPQRHESGTA